MRTFRNPWFLFAAVVFLAIATFGCGSSNLDGTWISGSGEIFEFSGKSFTRKFDLGPYEKTFKEEGLGSMFDSSGTFLLNGDLIEFNQDGQKVTASFKREGKTILINNVRFTRQ